MNVVLLDSARIRRRPARSNSWTSDEMEELARLYRAKCDQGSAVDFAYGDTDHHDPQFYVLNSHDAQPCAACVSRLVRHGRRWYVIEDGQGAIQTEGDVLRALVNHICNFWESSLNTLALFLTVIGQHYASDGPLSDSLVAVVDRLSVLA